MTDYIEASHKGMIANIHMSHKPIVEAQQWRPTSSTTPFLSLAAVSLDRKGNIKKTFIFIVAFLALEVNILNEFSALLNCFAA